MHLKPKEVLLTLDIRFKPAVSAAEIIAAVDRMKRDIQKAIPRIKRIFIEADAGGAGRASAPAARGWAPGASCSRGAASGRHPQ